MNAITIPVTLKPIKSGHSTITNEDYHEQVLMFDKSGYPVALFHVDTLYLRDIRNENEIYDLLTNGKEITCKVTFELEQTDERKKEK